MYILTYLYNYISRDFSLPLAIEMHGRPFFFSGPSLHRVLPYSLINIYKYIYVYIFSHKRFVASTWHININAYELKYWIWRETYAQCSNHTQEC